MTTDDADIDRLLPADLSVREQELLDILARLIDPPLQSPEKEDLSEGDQEYVRKVISKR